MAMRALILVPTDISFEGEKTKTIAHSNNLSCNRKSEKELTFCPLVLFFSCLVVQELELDPLA